LELISGFQNDIIGFIKKKTGVRFMNIGYLFLAIALFTGATKGYCGKKTSGSIASNADAMMFNFIRMLLCMVIGFVITFVSTGGVSAFGVDLTTLLLALMSGAFSSFFVISWLLGVKSGAYTMVDVFLLISTIIPMVGCAVGFNEEIRLNEIIGFIIILFAVAIMCSYNNSIKRKLRVRDVLLLLAMALSNGFADFSQKLFVYLRPEGNNAVFNFYTYVFSALVLLVSLLFAGKEERSISVFKNKKLLVYVSVMAAALFINSYFKVMAAMHISASILYPLNQGAALIISALMAAVFFGEKPKGKSVIGLVICFAGLCIMNML